MPARRRFPAPDPAAGSDAAPPARAPRRLPASRRQPAAGAFAEQQLDLLFELPDAAQQHDAPAPGRADGAAPGAPAGAPAAGPGAAAGGTAPATPSPGGTGAERLRTLQLGARTLHYRLKRSTRRTIGFSIDGNGLSITAPRWVTLADIEAAIAEKQRWIFTKLAEWQNRAEQRALPRIVWQDGAQLPFLGKTIRIALESASGTLHYAEPSATLALGLPLHAQTQQIKDRVQGWLQTQAKRLFEQRLDVYAERLGVRYQACALSSAATRWGSCSSDGKIRLNWRLIHFPLPIIDYVVAHELAHLREMNHGPRFWQTVESVFPEFREARQTLRKHPPELLPIL